MKNKKQDIMRHSASHLLAAAVLELYPKTLLGIGPATKDGFYYDFEFKKPISEEDLEKIEEKMQRLQKKKLIFEKKEVPLLKAEKIFQKAGQKYKVELLKDLAEEGEKKVSLYKLGDFLDLCAGPHVKNTLEIGPFKLLSIAGAYWKGSEKNKMLTRIYGTCFKNKKALESFLTAQEEKAKRDHRKIGKELNLFSFHPEAPGDVFWHPKGFILLQELCKYWREEHQRQGYVEIRTPVILNKKAWEQSGHTKYFLDKMYKVITPDSKTWNMAVKPMNCDGGILVYKSNQHSYKELPLRMAELGVVHRYESSGELHGIIRPREFTQDDAHIYCTPNQVKEELKKIINLCFKIYKTFKLEIDHIELSTRPKHSIGEDKIWEKAEKVMRQVLKEGKISHRINEGEGAFYGPKFDFHLKDSLGRTWQCATIQLDFAQPENFDLYYITPEGKKERPVMIHRTIYGSIERFLGILIEEYAGAFPVWLSPIQAVIIPITDKQKVYAQNLLRELRKEKIRVELDSRNETTSAKIREAEIQKIPYMIVVGPKEVKAKNVSIRVRGEKDLGQMTLPEFLKKIKEAIDKKE